jgi:hypothetical protein
MTHVTLGIISTVLALRGQVNPATSIFFVPDSDGWVYYPAVMDDPSMDLRPSLTRRNIRFFLWTRYSISFLYIRCKLIKRRNRVCIRRSLGLSSHYQIKGGRSRLMGGKGRIPLKASWPFSAWPTTDEFDFLIIQQTKCTRGPRALCGRVSTLTNVHLFAGQVYENTLPRVY